MERRVYRGKRPTLEFYCPLCRSKRFLAYRSKLSRKNYAQLFTLSLVLILLCYPFMGLRALFIFFIVWGVAETILKLFFRKEIPCPYCGFDATWYKRDVRVAKRLVEEFWKNKKEGGVMASGKEGGNKKRVAAASTTATSVATTANSEENVNVTLKN
ncbi:MAG: hypothetical protein HQK50_03205 [Oligoflexia bacterium]|nr:hypothetical protein [Oligoflexia bacterium]MBF0364550.1 hypothetical protein [Oligoflexia bacterium]